jgi:hypothetical protein
MTQSRNINKRLHGQRGNVLVWFALLLPVLSGFAALAVDLARLYLVKVELQNAADAAALAGAHKYAEPTSVSQATTAAVDLAKIHYANGELIPASFVTATEETGTGYTYAIKVKIVFPGLHFFFAPLLSIIDPGLGITSSDVQAIAIAGQNAAGHSTLVQ